MIASEVKAKLLGIASTLERFTESPHTAVISGLTGSWFFFFLGKLKQEEPGRAKKKQKTKKKEIVRRKGPPSENCRNQSTEECRQSADWCACLFFFDSVKQLALRYYYYSGDPKLSGYGKLLIWLGMPKICLAAVNHFILEFSKLFFGSSSLPTWLLPFFSCCCCCSLSLLQPMSGGDIKI